MAQDRSHSFRSTFLDDISSVLSTIGHALQATFRNMLEFKQQLLIPLAFWIGFNQQYIEGLFQLVSKFLSMIQLRDSTASRQSC